MKQALQSFKNGELMVEEVPKPVLKPGGVLVRNVRSLISSGTEGMLLELSKKSLLGKARERPDLVSKVLQKARRDGLLRTLQTVRERLDKPLPLGYSSAGLVTEVAQGVWEFSIGDRVACSGSAYANHAEVIFVPKNLCVQIPEAVSFAEAAFVAIGAIALHTLHQAQVALGETVAIIGLGLVGQVAVQIARAAGCRVFGIDIDGKKVALAKRLGADAGCQRNHPGLMQEIKSFSDGQGVDVALITAATRSNDPVVLAGEICRDRARVIVVGNVGMDIPRRTYYQKELEVRLVRSYGPGRYDRDYEEKGEDYPIGYVRWTEKRNMAEFLELIKEKKVDVKPLITHFFPITSAFKAYELITGKSKENHLGILLVYPTKSADQKRIYFDQQATASKVSKGTIGVGMIGAGNFARGTLLPILKKMPGLRLRGIVSAGGLSAKKAGEKFGFDYCASDYREILEDREIDAVIIATPHNLHANQVCEALERGKNVFVEKPLAINEEELSKVAKTFAAAQKILMVGYNRRFSPFAKAAKDFFNEIKSPLFLSYRVNAGPPAQAHWVKETGGRIIGEVCHFVDLAMFLVGSDLKEVYATPASAEPDSVTVTLKFSNASSCALQYLTAEAPSYSKERIEIFGGGLMATIDDFRRAEFICRGKKRKVKRFVQDKGHQDELKAFFQAIRDGGPLPIPFRQILMSSVGTLRIIDSLKKGIPCPVYLVAR